METVLENLNISCSIPENDRNRIPREGPVIVTANHLYGQADAWVLAKALLSVRTDVRIIIRGRAQGAPGSESIWVWNPVEAKPAAILAEAEDWLKRGGVLGIFPAETPRTLVHLKRKNRDKSWDPLLADLIGKTNAQVLPAVLTNPRAGMFHLLGLAARSRPLAVRFPKGIPGLGLTVVEVGIGNVIPFSRLNRFESGDKLIEYLRLKTNMLGRRDNKPGQAKALSRTGEAGKDFQPIAPPVDPEALAGEIAGLPGDSLLVESGKFRVFEAEASSIPLLIREIGRLREVTFREVGEGTGLALDTDVFDRYYRHLFLWNSQDKELVGGYRLGLSDKIVQGYGKEGFYTYTLFKYSKRFIEEISPALELGRSFVRPEYQKTYQALMLLWKGIGEFVARRPRYKILFGPVSITSDYHSASRHLIAAYLRENIHRDDLARLVKPRNPLQKREALGRDINAALPLLQDIHELSDLVSDIEDDSKGIPILLKQYVKLGGKSLCFNVDQNFQDVLDALILVDLTQTDNRILERYMGHEGARTFGEYHRKAEAL
ncbi:MAG: GNAT family N-acyltransferase [Pseudomonadota bacterium]